MTQPKYPRTRRRNLPHALSRDLARAHVDGRDDQIPQIIAEYNSYSQNHPQSGRADGYQGMQGPIGPVGVHGSAGRDTIELPPASYGRPLNVVPMTAQENNERIARAYGGIGVQCFSPTLETIPQEQQGIVRQQTQNGGRGVVTFTVDNYKPEDTTK